MTLVPALRDLLGQALGSRRVLVWYDPGATLEHLAPQAIPEGVRFQAWQGSLLATRTAFERADPSLEERWVICIPRRRLQPSWFRDLELAGEVLDLGLGDLIARAHDVALTPRVRDALAGPAGRALAVRWDELIDRHPPTADDLQRGMIAAALRLGGSGLRDIVIAYVTDARAPVRLTELGLQPELRAILEAEAGLILPEGDVVPPERVAAALLLSEAASKGALEVAPFEGLLPRTDLVDRWAGWAREWMERSDHSAFVRWARDVERRFDLPEHLRVERLEEVQSFPAVDDILVGRVHELVAGHDLDEARRIADARRTSFWSRTGGSAVPWDAIRAALDLLDVAGGAAENLRLRSPWTLGPLLDAYVTDWWVLDDAYRRLEAHWSSVPESLLGSVAHPAAAAYGAFLDALGAAASSSIEGLTAWQVNGWASQDRIARDELGEGEGVALILADALRLDLGRLLAERLRGRNLTVTERPTLAALPSVTQVGMAAIQARGWDAREPTIVSGRLTPTVDGTLMTGRAERLEALRRRFPRAAAAELDEVQQARRAPGGVPLVVYAGCIDEQGDALPQVGLDLFELLVGTIVDGVVKLLDGGYRKVVIVPDHGFVLVPRQHDLRVVEAPRADPTTARGRRYAVGQPGDTPGAVRVPLARLGWQGDGYLAVPSGLSVFALPGAVPRFFHGGPMPQEVGVVSLVVTRATTAVPVHVRILGPTRIDTTIPRFTLEGEAELLAYPRRVRVVARVAGQIAGSSDIVEIAPGDRSELTVRLERYGSSVEARVEDADTGMAVETKVIPVELPPGYEFEL